MVFKKTLPLTIMGQVALAKIVLFLGSLYTLYRAMGVLPSGMFQELNQLLASHG